MSKHLLTCVLLLTSFQATLMAQPYLLEGVRLVDETGPIRVTCVEVYGLTNGPQGPELVYSFVHPRGAIQQVNGSVVSGGQRPASLLALGSIDIGIPDEPKTGTLRWAADSAASTSVNYFPDPLLDIASQFNEPLAKVGEVLPYQEARVTPLAARRSDPLCHQICQPGSPEAPRYTPTYFLTHINLGILGGIAELNTKVYTFNEPHGPYKRASFTVHPKDKYAAAFEDEAMYFEPGSTSTISDPATGNASIFGAIKYRRNPHKENSPHHEFKFLMFSKEGDLRANFHHHSQLPMVADGCYEIHSHELAPGIAAVSGLVCILRGGGSEGIAGVDSSQVQLLFFDMETGQLMARDSATFTQPGGRCVSQRQLPGGELELSYLYAEDGHQKGISVMVIGDRRIKSIIDYLGDAGSSLQLSYLPDKPISLRNLQCIPLEDGNQAALQVIAEENRDKLLGTSTYQPLGYALSIYQPNGYLEAFLPLPVDMPAISKTICLAHADSDRLVFTAPEQSGGLNRISLLEVNLHTYAVSLSKLPDGYTLWNPNNVYLSREQKLLYLLAQPTAGKGLYVFYYRL